MGRITVEIDKIQSIRNQLDMLLQTPVKIETGSYKHHIKQKLEPLDDKEKEIMEFIKNNPGTSIKFVVDSVKYARVTVFKTINRLISYEMIHVELDKKKKRTHRLYVNDDSLIVSVMDDIKKFNKSYINLIKTAVRIYKNMVARDDPKYVGIMGNNLLYSQTISDNLITILKHLITSYSLSAVFEWPKRITDTEGLYRLYVTVFQSFNGIFSELAKYVPFHLKESNEKLMYLDKYLMSLYGEFEIYQQMVIDFNRYDLDREFDSVMSNLFTASKMPREWREIRTAMEEQ